MSELPAIALKRIMRDLKEINTDESHAKNGIYISYDESNLSMVRAMIIGPKDTPYEGGFYLFEFRFGSTYPFEPPKGTFMTRDPFGKCRFHPNLYVEGKICLSLLGTWSGPLWSSVQTLSSVLLSIQSIMNENPLVNEPSYEVIKKGYHDNYNYVVQHENFRTAIIHELTSPKGLPNDYKYFLPIMEKYFVDNYQSYIDRCVTLDKEFSGRTVTSSVYGMTIKCDYKSILKSLENAYKTLAPKYQPTKPAESEKAKITIRTKDVPASETGLIPATAQQSMKKKVIIKKKQS